MKPRVASTTSLRGRKGPCAPPWLEVATSAPVAQRAFILALVVGTVLALINHGDKIWDNAVSATDLFKIGLTFFVPYTVSTISSVLASRDLRRAVAEARCEGEATRGGG